MWFYLFGQNGSYPEPLSEIRALAKLDESGRGAYLKLSARDDAPLKNAREGDRVYLCTRDRGQWLVHGEAVVAGSPLRGGIPESMSSLYGAADEHRWWRRLADVRLHPTPKREADLGLPSGTLPAAGRAYVIRVRGPKDAAPPGAGAQPTSSPLARLTEVMDDAWEAGRLTPEAIQEAIEHFRKAHPYGR
jgi:hypothetical protein